MQVLWQGPDRLAMKFREGSPHRHFQAEVSNLRQAHRVLTAWASEEQAAVEFEGLQFVDVPHP